MQPTVLVLREIIFTLTSGRLNPTSIISWVLVLSEPVLRAMCTTVRANLRPAPAGLFECELQGLLHASRKLLRLVDWPPFLPFVQHLQVGHLNDKMLFVLIAVWAPLDAQPFLVGLACWDGLGNLVCTLPIITVARRPVSDRNTMPAHELIVAGFNPPALVAETMCTVGSCFRP